MRFLILTLLLLNFPVMALTISYNITPEIVLPNGYADCLITITNTGPEIEIESISFFSKTVDVFPNPIQNVGTISPNSIYKLKVSMSSAIPGRHEVEMIVSAKNVSISQKIELIVDDKFPQISLVSPLYRGEANTAKFLISSPIPLQDFRVEAIFNATPKIFYLGNLNGVAEIQLRLSEEVDTLKFKLSFYNSRSYHELEREIKVEYLQSKEVAVNLQAVKNVIFLGEAVNLSLEITNLRSDEIYKLEIKASGGGKFSNELARIDKLNSGEKKVLNFIFSPKESGVAEVIFNITYCDFFGRVQQKEERIKINVLDSYALQITNMEKETLMGKTKISGEVVNYGHRSALNVEISALCNGNKTNYYIGEIEGNDYETFELEVPCIEIVLSLSWWNDAGGSFKTSQELKVESKLEKQESSFIPTLLAIIATLTVISFVAYILIRARRK